MICSLDRPLDGTFSFHAARWVDEEESIVELELVKIIITKGKKMGAKDFFIGGDLNIELKMESSWEDEFRGLDSLDWYGLVDLYAKEEEKRRNFDCCSF